MARDKEKKRINDKKYSQSEKGKETKRLYDKLRNQDPERKKHNYNLRQRPEIKKRESLSNQKKRLIDPAAFLMKGILSRSLEEGYQTDIDADYLRSILPKYCPMIGIRLEPKIDGSRGQAPNSLTVDKIYPEKRYMKGNVMVISNLANTMKNTATVQQIIALARNLKYVTEEQYPYGPQALKELGVGKYEPTKETLEHITKLHQQALKKTTQPVPVVPVPVVVGVEGEGPVTVAPVPVIPVVINKYVPLEEVSISVQITDTSETTLAITVPVPPHPKVEVGPTDLAGYSSYSPEVYISPSLQYLYDPSQHTHAMLDEPCRASSAEPAKPTAH